MEKKPGKKIYLSRSSLILRIVAAVYLLYVVISVKDALFQAKGKEQIIMGIICLVFLVFGIYLGVISIKAMVKKEYIEALEEENDSEISEDVDEILQISEEDSVDDGILDIDKQANEDEKTE